MTRPVGSQSKASQDVKIHTFEPITEHCLDGFKDPPSTHIVVRLDTFASILADKWNRASAYHPDKVVTSSRSILFPPCVKIATLSQWYDRLKNVGELDIEDPFGRDSPKPCDHFLVIRLRPTGASKWIPSIWRGEWEMGNIETQAQARMIL
jgi:hypothetical protein